MKLYVKNWCPWCIDAVNWLEKRRFSFEEVDVIADDAGYRRMIEISGQRKTPTLELSTGEVLPDFDVQQLEKFLDAHDIQPVNS